MGNENLFTKFSILIEKYPIEVFTFEILIALLLNPSAKTAIFLFGGVIFTGLFAGGIKLFFREKRPEEALKREFYKKNLKLNRRSFPSDHSAVAMFFPTVFYGTILFVPFLIFAVIVMYSRIYIKSHYLRDVLAGALIGIFIGLISTGIMERIKI